MVKNEVVIDGELCHGCGYCVQFCPRGCLDMPGEHPGPMYSGYEIAEFINPDQCNACGICSRMCPCGAIEVYLTIEAPRQAATREKVAGTPRLLPSAGFGDCVGCQKATVGRIIADVLDELGLEGKFIGLDAVRCDSSSAFGRDFNIVVERENGDLSVSSVHTKGISTVEVHDDAIARASELKITNPDKLVFVVQDTAKFEAVGMDSFVNGLMRGDNITVINCNEMLHRGDSQKGQLGPPSNPVHSPGRRDMVMGDHPLHLTELASTFGGVSYSARGAITSPDDYEQTKSYIREAFQDQINGNGTSFVEVLCACYSQAYESPWDTLKWIHDKVVAELPLLELKSSC